MAEPNASAGNGLGNILELSKMLMPMIFGGPKTTGTSSGADPASMQMNQQLFAALGLDAADAEGQTSAMVDRIIEKAAIAFAPVVGQQNASGLYNSTVIKQLSAQAGASASKEAASAVLDYKTNSQKLQAAVGGNLLANGPRTTTSQVAPTIPPMISSALSAAMLAKSAHAMFTKEAKDTAKKIPKPTMFDNDPEAIIDGVIDPNAAGAASEAATPGSASTGGGESIEFTNPTVDAFDAGFQGSGVDVASGELIDTAGFLQPELLDVYEAPAASGEELLTAGGDIAGEAGVFNAAGDLISAGAGYELGADALAGLGAASGIEAGFAAGGAELIGSSIGGSLAAEEVLAAAVLWVICTELKSRKLLDAALYAEGAKHISRMSPATIRGYHLWAVPYTRWMRKSSFATKFILPFAVGRTKHLAGQKNLLGLLTVIIGEPVCWLLGKLFKEPTDWRVLYGSR